MIVTFRGHSYSLLNSFPPGIFCGKKSHIVFIPGSCASTGVIPKYLSENPNTDIRFFSNISTGRGEATNSIVEALMESPKKKFGEVVAEATKIVAYGSLTGVRTWTKGEALMRYVLNEAGE